MNISILRNRHKGRTVHVFGSGAELNSLDPKSFKGEVTVTLNLVPLYWRIKPTYALTKYHDDARRLLRAGILPVVASYGDRGYLAQLSDEFPYVYTHGSMMPHGTFNIEE